MSELIADTRYWKRRLRDAPKDALHHAIFRCPLDRWLRIEAKHREILAATIKDADYVLDAGCGWGRLLSLMPTTWCGDYLGVDLSPDFIALAQEKWPGRAFMVNDMRTMFLPPMFDVAVMISIRPMVIRELGGSEWDKMEVTLRQVCKRLLYMEYDEHDGGSVE